MSKKGKDVLTVSLRKTLEKRERRNVTVALLVGLLVLIIGFTRLTFTGYVVETSSCGTLSTAGETYILTNDISASGTCFTIGANNIILDCAGHTITGSGAYGIVISGKSGVTIKNCKVSNFIGIYLGASSNNILTNNTVTSSSYGIYLSGASNNIIAGNIAQGNGYGIWIANGALNNTITNNIANSNSYGIWIHDGLNEIITNNIANSNSYGIQLIWHSNNNSIINNTANSNTNYGIGLDRYVGYDCDNSYNTFTNNIANDNRIGIYFNCGRNNTLRKNNVLYNREGGIYLINSNTSRIYTNNIYNNSGYKVWSDQPIELSYNGQGNW